MYIESEFALLEANNEQLTREIKTLAAVLEDVKPTFYGMLLIEFGNPDKWPEDRQGVVVFRKLEQALAKAGE